MGRNQNLNRQITDKRREEILASALKLFAAQGLEATRIEQITETLHISKGLVYYYFRSKEELYVEIVRAAFERLNAAATGLAEMPLPPGEKISFAIRHMLGDIEYSDTFAQYFVLILQATVQSSAPPEAKEIIRREGSTPHEALARIMREGQREGTVKPYDPADLSVLFWSTIRGLATHKAAHGTAYKSPDPQLIEEIFLIKGA